MLNNGNIYQVSNGRGRKFARIMVQQVTVQLEMGSQMNKLRKTSILVCEDNVLMMKGLQYLLNQFEDLEVIGLALNGNQAVSKARELEPDVILMDLDMPELNGLSATSIIKAERPYVRIIVVSAAQDEKTMEDIARAGADGFYPKPVMNPDELYWKIVKDDALN